MPDGLTIFSIFIADAAGAAASKAIIGSMAAIKRFMTASPP